MARRGGLLLLLALPLTHPAPGLKSGSSTSLASHPNSILAASTKLGERSDAPRLPVFLEHPKDGFVIKARPAQLNCSVVYSEKAYFSCNGEALSQSGEHTERDSVDGLGRVRRVLTVLIHREQVEEYFDEFRCQCDAWSSLGQTSSKVATVNTGYLNKEFEVPPYSQSVTLGSQVELRCHPPSGQPRPRIYWMKNKMEIQVERDSNFLQSADGHLIIVQVRPEDVGNFTCVAESIINRRVSPPARLDIFVDGGWSSWAPWTDCDVRCGKGSQRRQRVCNNPAPSLNGVYCLGDGEQTQGCTSLCQKAGAWSSWSSWSTCNPLCSHYRRRACTSPPPSPGGQYCRGRDQGSAPCSGGMCRPSQPLGDSPNNSRTREAAEAVQADMALLVGLGVALAVFCCVSLASIRLIRRKGRTSQSIYNMATLPCRTEFLDKPEGPGKRETHFSFPGARRIVAEDKQVLQLDFPTSATSSPHPDVRRSATSTNSANSSPHPDTRRPPASATSSPHPDTRRPPASATSSPHPGARRPGGPQPPLLSPTRSEHQYDVPFSHLLPRRHNKRREEGDGYSAPGGEAHYTASTLGNPSPLAKEWPPPPSSPPSSPGSAYSGLVPPLSSSLHIPHSNSSLLPPGLEPDSFTYMSVGQEGGRLSLPEWGVSLLVPRGALDHGYVEEVFLAVLLEPHDLPTLYPHQTRLSPVVLAGPPRLSFQKPVVLSFGHCAGPMQEGWEIGLYHCDSMFSEGKEESWVKLVTVGQEAPSSPILTHLDFSSCFLLTDFLSRFCLVGQARPGQVVVRGARVVVLGRRVGEEANMEIHLIPDTTAATMSLLRTRQKLGLKLLHKPRNMELRDGGGDLCLRVVGCGAGWSLRSRKSQELELGSVWADEGEPHFSLTLEHQDLAVQHINLDFTVFQKQKKELGQMVSVAVDLTTLSSPTSRTSACSSLVASSSGCSSLPASPLQAFKLPGEVRSALCSALDHQQASGVDWRALAVGLRLGRHLDFYHSRASPTDSLLTLWEAQQTDQAAITDLLNIVRVIGKPDIAARLEKEVGSWV